LRSWLILGAALAVTSLALAFTVDVTLQDQAGVTLDLPREIGEWTGAELRYCLAPTTCGVQSIEGEWTDPTVCPKCGGKLDIMSSIEKGQLPPDTEMARKRYLKPDGDQVLVSIILSGRERASIHRPEQCLTGQGNRTVAEHVFDVPLPGRDPLKVKMLELMFRGRTADGQVIERGSYYAYWFAGVNRETPDHFQRMVWLATDRIFHSRGHRWAYIAVSGYRDPATTHHLDEAREVIAGLYPAIHRNAPPP
jgi:hypothetical protein